MGSQGIYTHTVSYERDSSCPICGSGVPLDVDRSMTLQQARRSRRGCKNPIIWI